MHVIFIYGGLWVHVCLCMCLVGKGMYFETHEEGGALTVNESFFLCHGAFRLFPCPSSS